jgi:organic hydroperoxide reductase OsmC/OhrA
MPGSHKYAVSGSWVKGSGGILRSDASAPTVTFSSPSEFGGEPGLWTPEYLLLAAVAGCFVSTFAAIAAFSKFGFDSLDIVVHGEIQKVDGGWRFTTIEVQPTLTVAAAANGERAVALLAKAEAACLVSRSLSSKVTMTPTVRKATTDPTATPS